MPVDRELIEIVTAANLAGVEAAQKSFLGLNASTIALAAVLAILYKVGQDAVANYNAQETALALLKQATDATGLSYTKLKTDVEDFIQTNKSYIANQYDVVKAAGEIIRAGNDEAETMRLLNDALDLAVIKHEDVSVAATTLIQVEAGNSRALRELGITRQQYDAIMKSNLTTEQKDAELLDLIEGKLGKGRDTTDKMSQSQQRLNTDWQNFTARIGPQLVGIIGALTDALATGVEITDLWFQLLGSPTIWKAINDNVTTTAEGVREIGQALKFAADQAERLFGWMRQIGGGSAQGSNPPSYQRQ